MKKSAKMFTRMCAAILLAFCCLGIGGCGKGNDADNYSDIFVETLQMPDVKSTVNTDNMMEYVYLGAQFFQGEKVQLWGERKTAGGGIYLHREDGSKELLADGVSGLYLGGNRWWLDREKRCFILGSDCIRRVNNDGSIAFKQEMESRPNSICQLEDGRILVLVWKNAGSYGLAELDPESGDLKLIENVDLNLWGNALITADENGLVLLKQNGIWDVSLTDGAMNCRLSFEGTSYTLKADIPGGAGDSGLQRKEDFRLLEDRGIELLWSDGRSEVLHLEQISQNKEVLVLRTILLDSMLSENIVKFNQENPDYYIIIEKQAFDDEDYDAFLRRTEIDLAAGKGADIIISNAVSDVSSLLEKEVFADLTPFMEASGLREEDFFPSAFSGWKDDNGTYGLRFISRVSNFWLDTAVIGEEAITDADDLVNRLLAYPGDGIFPHWGEIYILRTLLGCSENLCGMVDFENNTCSFEGELFVKMLETAKKYADNERNENAIEAGDSMEYRNFFAFNDSEFLSSKGRKAVGYLFDDGMYPKMEGDVIAINAKSDKKEGAWAFLNFLLGEEAQSNFCRDASRTIDYTYFPVNRNAFEKLCKFESKPSLTFPDGYVDSFGTQWANPTEERMAELRAVLENARSAPLHTEPVIKMIVEETQAYFSGDKSLAEVQQTLQNRVTLYLQEKK